MTAMPPDLTYGKVVGRFLLSVGDGPDAERMPDGYPASGSITFLASSIFRETGIAEPATLLPQPLPCAIDADGYLIDLEGVRGVWLVAGHYRVEYDLAEGRIDTHDIIVAGEHTDANPLDLTLYIQAGRIPTPSEYAELNKRIDTEIESAATAAAEPVLVAELNDTTSPSYGALVDAAGTLTDPQVSGLIGDSSTETVGALQAREPHILVTDYGAKGDGVTDDTAAIKAAIADAAAPTPAPRQVYFPEGTYLHNQDLALHDLKNISLVGDSRSLLADGGAVLKWTGSDTEPQVSVYNAVGVRISGLKFNVPETYTAAQIDGRHPDNVMSQAYAVTIEDCTFSSDGTLAYDTAPDAVAGTGGNQTCIRTGFSHTWRITGCDFYRANVHVMGADPSTRSDAVTGLGESSQTVLIVGNFFEPQCRTAHIVNPGEGWQIDGSVEPLWNGDAGFVKLLPNYTVNNVNINAAWCGDISDTGAGTQVEVAGQAWNITGSMLWGGQDTTAIKCVGDTFNLNVQGNWHGYKGTFIDWGTFTHFNPVVLGASQTSGTTFAGTIPRDLLTHDQGTGGLRMGRVAVRSGGQVSFESATPDTVAGAYISNNSGYFTLGSQSGGTFTNRLESKPSEWQQIEWVGLNEAGDAYDTLMLLDHYTWTMPKTIKHTGAALGFYGIEPVSRPTVTGSHGGNAALTSLLQALASQGLIVDSTTA